MNAMNDIKTDSTNAAWHQRRLDATPRGVGVMGDFFIDKAKNAEFWDIEGRRFIDFAGGIAVLNTGHVHPKVQAAIAAQLQRFTHSCYQVVPYTEYVALAERINAMVPIDGPVKTAFFSTGAEAIENAMKIARYSTGRTGVIAFGGAFHGRSMFSVALTGKVQPYKAGFGPFPPEIYHVPFRATAVRSTTPNTRWSSSSSATSSPAAWRPSCSSRFRARAGSTPSSRRP
jgi:4-aminobutyrate aminotransferase